MRGPSEPRRGGGHGEPQQEDGTRRPTRPARTPKSREQRSSFFTVFYEAMVKRVTYVTDFL